MRVDLPTPVVAVLGGIFGVLVVSSLVVAVRRKRRPDRDDSELRQRVRSWWIMAGVFTAALLVSRNVSIAFLGFVSFLALKEYLSVIPTRRVDRRALFYAYCAIPVQYYWVATEWYGMFAIFIPVYMFLLIPIRIVLVGETDGFLRSVGTVHWGLMTTVFSISHAAYLLVLRTPGAPAGEGAGLLLYLVLLTQSNDVAQYVWGKSFGRRKIVPEVSPKKTWEGFLGGVATTTGLALALGSSLTPFEWWQMAVAGAGIGLFGFFGDVTISALKRDLHIKDSGNLIPGHGGILDRLDSLTYTAPLFFHYTYYLHY
ncbi:MAG: phosphatidate cytidylyltransferase [Planctomycetes bacterium]|nr:phosphatidate cytidylyltransferase [Planctomycetota bacterium]